MLSIFKERMFEPGSAGAKRMLNVLDPGRTTAAERLDEIACLLALGYLRLRERTRVKDPNHSSKFELDFRGEQRVCVDNAHAHGEHG